MDSPCVAFNQHWDVWICGKHPAVEKRTNCFHWAPPSRINTQDPEKSLREYETFILSSPLKTKLLPTLYGKTFGCWCYRGGPCHGPTLASLAKRAYESQSENNGPLKRPHIPPSFYNFTQTPSTYLLSEPKFISCFIDHQNTGNTIWVEEISQPITTQPLKEPFLIPISEDTYSISLGPHKVRPLITYRLENDRRYANIVSLCNELLEKLDKDISFYGLGLSNLTIHSTRELINNNTNDTKQEPEPITILIPNENANDAIVDDPLVDSENMCVIHTLLITTRDPNEKVLQRVALFFTQHFIDLQYYDADQVFDLLSNFY